MQTKAHGIDVVECSRLAEAIDRHGEHFLQRVFTEGELAYCRGKKREIEHLAGRFAAKEAVLKVLGTGWVSGISWTDIEVLNDQAGRPHVTITGRCKEIAKTLGLDRLLISISHTSSTAIASVIGVGETADAPDLPA